MRKTMRDRRGGYALRVLMFLLAGWCAQAIAEVGTQYRIGAYYLSTWWAGKKDACQERFGRGADLGHFADGYHNGVWTTFEMQWDETYCWTKRTQTDSRGETSTSNLNWSGYQTRTGEIASPPPELEGGTCPDGASVGHPILPATGEKLLQEIDYEDFGPHPLHLVRTYRSSRVLGDLSGPWANGLAQAWVHNHSAELKTLGTPGTAGSRVRVLLGDGTVRAFSWDAAVGWRPPTAPTACPSARRGGPT